MAIDVDSLLAEINADAPCGDDLEYDADMGELERAAAGKEEQQFGDTVIAATEPEFGAVRTLSFALLERTHDLRILPLLARALIDSDGYVGLADVLALLRGYVERYWDSVHPQLDPDDDNDPTLRVNTVRALCDGATMLAPLRQAPLVNARGIGSFSLLDLALASGEVAASEHERAPQLAEIEGAFSEAPLADLQATSEAVQASREHIAALDVALAEHVGAGNAPDLSPLDDLLKSAQRALGERLARRDTGADASGTGDDAGSGMDVSPAAAPAGDAAAPTGAAFSGHFASRDEIVVMLDRACAYYAAHEPSSPVPILLRRAKKLVHMDFMAIVKDLVPDGADQAATFRGSEASDDDDGSENSEDEFGDPE